MTANVSVPFVNLSAAQMLSNPVLSQSNCLICLEGPEDSNKPWVAHYDVNQRIAEIANQEIPLLHAMHKGCAIKYCVHFTECPLKDVNLQPGSITKTFSEKLGETLSPYLSDSGEIAHDLLCGIAASTGLLLTPVILETMRLECMFLIKTAGFNSETYTFLPSALLLGSLNIFVIYKLASALLNKNPDLNMAFVLGGIITSVGTTLGMLHLQATPGKGFSQADSLIWGSLLSLGFGTAAVGAVSLADRVKSSIARASNSFSDYLIG